MESVGPGSGHAHPRLRAVKGRHNDVDLCEAEADNIFSFNFRAIYTSDVGLETRSRSRDRLETCFCRSRSRSRASKSRSRSRSSRSRVSAVNLPETSRDHG